MSARVHPKAKKLAMVPADGTCRRDVPIRPADMTWSAVYEVQFVDLAATLTLTCVLALSDPVTPTVRRLN